MRRTLPVLAAIACLTVSTAAVRRRAATPGLERVGIVVALPAMSESRAVHSATLLPDGTVLIAGGLAGSSFASSAELFDPGTNTFRPTGRMTTTRAEHSATLLPNGKVLIAGGLHGDTLNTSELYDPQRGTFTAGPRLTASRSGHIAVLMKNGKVLLAGGSTGPSSSFSYISTAEVYDPATNTFTATGRMNSSRGSHTATLLPNGKVLITGGHTGRGASTQIHASTELYDPAAGTFRNAASMIRQRHKHDAALLADGRVLIIAGADARDDLGMYRDTEIYDPATDSFIPGPLLQSNRYKLNGTSVMLSNGKILIAGGAPFAERFDPQSQTSATIRSDMQMRGNFSGVVPLPDGRVLITGGYGNGQGPSAAAWIYVP